MKRIEQYALNNYGESCLSLQKNTIPLCVMLKYGTPTLFYERHDDCGEFTIFSIAPFKEFDSIPDDAKHLGSIYMNPHTDGEIVHFYLI